MSVSAEALVETCFVCGGLMFYIVLQLFGAKLCPFLFYIILFVIICREALESHGFRLIRIVEVMH